MSEDTFNSSPDGLATSGASDNYIPPKRTFLRRFGLAILFIWLVATFTLLKLPQTRITGLIQGYVQQGLDPFGVYISDQGREFSILHGLRYTLTKPSIDLSDQTRIELDDLSVAPKLSALLSGKAGMVASLHQGPASIDIDASGRGDKIDLNATLVDVDIGKMGVLSYAANLKGSGLVNGTIQVAGSLADPTTLEGSIDLKVKRLHLDEQNLMGFQLPPMNVSDGTINILVTGGKLVMKTVQLGKGSDDFVATVTGDITLRRNVNSSLMNLRAVFGLSEKVKQSLSLLDTILGGAKMADGRYAYKLTGSLSAPFANPDPK